MILSLQQFFRGIAILRAASIPMSGQITSPLHPWSSPTRSPGERISIFRLSLSEMTEQEMRFISGIYGQRAGKSNKYSSKRLAPNYSKHDMGMFSRGMKAGTLSLFQAGKSLSGSRNQRTSRSRPFLRISNPSYLQLRISTERVSSSCLVTR